MDAAAESLVQEAAAEMVTSSQRRKGVFLKPVPNPNAAARHEFADAPTAVRGPTPAGVHFKGWVGPQRLWGEWLDKLKPTYMGLWRRLGIYEAIGFSTCKIKRDPSSIWAAVGFWCGDTNTFMFPWGEATLTLEDVMVLAGFPLLGDPVRLRNPLTGEMLELETRLAAVLKTFNKTKCKKPDAAAWIRHHLEAGRGDEEEHAAFLALWLSRYVLPSHPEGIVRHSAVHIAVRLARGVRIALAPAVLASLYRDLRAMKAYVRSPGADSPLVVWAPLDILQLWVWERFPSLRPATVASVGSDEPRAARWSQVGKVMELSYVNSVLKSREEFRLRPYADHWTEPAFYKDDGEWISDRGVVNEELRSFAMCLRACELVGYNCIEQYLPHRVAMQFGFDQDVPNSVSRVNTSWEAAWGTYDITGKNVNFYVSPSRYDSDATLQYSIWWRNARRNSERKRDRPQSDRQKKKNKKQKIQDVDDDIPLSAWIPVKNPDSEKRSSTGTGRYGKVYQRKKSTKSEKPLLITAAVTQEQRAISALTNLEIKNQDLNALKDGSETLRGENLISDVENKEIMEDVEETNVEESVAVSTAVEEVPENFMGDIKEGNVGESVDNSMVMQELVPENFTDIENPDALREVRLGGISRQGEEIASELADIENNVSMGGSKQGNVEESVGNSMAVEEVPENVIDVENSVALREVQQGGDSEHMEEIMETNVQESVDASMVINEVLEDIRMEGMERIAASAVRSAELGLEIQQLKKDIASIQATIMEIESQQT